MKNLPQFSLVLLCCLFACETDTEIDVPPTFIYTANEQFLTTEFFTIDFEAFNTGDMVSEIFITDSFKNAQVAGITMAFPNRNAAMIFDSSNLTGNDFDIGTPNAMYGGPGLGNGGASNAEALGNVLILSEDLDATHPDDIFEVGASFVFDFSANTNVTLNSFDILDIEDASNPTIVNLYDNGNNVIFSEEVTPGGDNSKITVDLERTSGVAFMEIIMNSSGAIDNIDLELETEKPCAACDSRSVELTFKYTGAVSLASVRFETLEGNVIFDNTLHVNEEFTISGNAADGRFESELIVYIENEEITILATDCSQVIGPGYIITGLEVVSGRTQTDCHVVKTPRNDETDRHYEGSMTEVIS
jgi:hypothetical protein